MSEFEQEVLNEDESEFSPLVYYKPNVVVITRERFAAMYGEKMSKRQASIMCGKNMGTVNKAMCHDGRLQLTPDNLITTQSVWEYMQDPYAKDSAARKNGKLNPKGVRHSWKMPPRKAK